MHYTREQMGPEMPDADRILSPRVAARNRGKPAVPLSQRISRSLNASDAKCPSRMPPTSQALFRGWARTFFFAVLFTGARPGAALPPNLSLSQIQHTAWTAKQGAPADIWALAQSPDGFLLLGTGSGLYRFDGVTFERIIPSNQPDLAFRDITAVLALPSGELWIGYYAGGVSELKNGVLTSYGRLEGVPSGWITSFARESDGTLWVAAREGLGRFSAGHWETVTSDWNFRGHGAHWVLLDHQGTLWVAGGETVAFLPRGAHKFEDTGIRSGYNSTLALAPDGTVWLSGESLSPRPLMEHQAQLARDEPPERLDPVKRLLLDREGSIWATDSLRGGVYRATQRDHDADAATPHPSIEMFTEAEGLTSDLAVPLLEDHEGNIWVGTNLGLNRFRATRFVREWRVPTSRTLYALAAAPDGSVWIASHEQLFEVHGSRCDLIARLPSPIRSAYRDPGGALWLGTQEGLVELLDKKPNSLPLPAPARPVQYQYVHAMTSDTSHGLWVSVVNRGLLRFDDHRWELPGSGLQLPVATPTALWTDTTERQWLGYGDGTAALRAGDSTQVFGPDQGLQVGPIMVIRGSAGEILVGGEWGLARLDGRRFQSLSASRSDAFSGISGIIVRANGDIWLNGNRGVVHMSSDALNDAYAHPLTTLRYDLFDVQDGLPGYAQQGEDASAVAAADGRLWFATNHGIAWIDPDHLIRNRIPPNVVIRSVLADQRAYRGAGPIELPEATRSVRIDYTALSLTAPERIRFRYKLDGADDTWRDGGNERSVRYANLRPGHYTFRVIASNNDGVWNDVGATVAFALRPAFYQTSWFLVLVSAACLGILWLLLLARLRQITYRERKRLEQRMEDRLNERTRIARELHDSLLQGFQGLMFRLQAVRLLLPERPVDAASVLDSALGVADQAIYEGRDAIQNLRSSTFDDHDLPAALGTLGAELSVGIETQSPPEYRVVVEGRPRELVPVLRDDIYRIVREAVRNAYQHANAKHIETEVTFGERELRVRVRDDGIGVDPQILIRGQRAGHWGLPGMRERSESFGGQLDVWSEKNAGTEIELRISAHIAYARPPIAISRRIRSFLEHYSMRLRPNIRASTDHAPGPNMAKARPSAPATTDNEVQR
jgi:signal transduction histidine kinase/ligand-binding sensor domain-containing protein